MRTLTHAEVINEVSQIGNGRFTRFAFKSEVPLKAAYKKAGWIVTKITETTGRVGVNYNHIEKVIKRKSDPNYTPKEVTNNYSWVVPNKIKYNSNTEKSYVSVAYVPHGHNVKTKYVVEKPNGDTYTVDKLNDEERDLAINSYWTRSSDESEVFNIPTDRFIRINNIGTKVFAVAR